MARVTIILVSAVAVVILEAVVGLLPAAVHLPRDASDDYVLPLIAVVVDFNLFFAVFLSRQMSRDLATNRVAARHQPAFHWVGLSVFFLVAYCFYETLVYALLAGRLPGASMTELLAAATEPRLLFFQIVIFPATALANGIIGNTLFSQGRCLTGIVNALSIRLELIEQYAFIGSPLVRFLIFVLSFLALVPLGVLAFNETIALIATVVIVVGGLVLAGFYFYPVWRLRNRIRSEKLRQLDLVSRALNQDDAAISAVAELNQGQTTRTDLLVLQMFIESRWEWSIAPYLQRILIFGVLPPLSWAMAATVENLLY